MKNVKKIKSIVICLFVFMLSIAFADTAKAETTEYDLCILGERVTSDNMSGEGWRYEPATGEGEIDKLYLTNANLIVNNDNVTSDVSGKAIHTDQPLEIVLEGTNTINMNATNLGAETSYDAMDIMSIVVSGSGKLNVEYDEFTFSGVQDIAALYSNYVEIEEGVEINIDANTISSDAFTEDNSINWVGIFSNCIKIHSNAKVSINMSGVNLLGEGDICRMDVIHAIELEIHENGELDVHVGNMKGETVEVGGIYSRDSFVIGNNAQVDVRIDSIVADNFGLKAISSDSIYVGDSGKIAAEMETASGLGDEYSIYALDVQIGNGCKIFVKSASIDCDIPSLAVFCSNMDIGEASTIEAYSGAKCGIGISPETFTIGKDSIIKCYGEGAGFAYFNSEAPTYPVYGGNNKNDINALTFSEMTVLGETCFPAVYGENPAKYAEIGSLLTINLNANGGDVNRKSFTMHNGRAIGTLPTPTRAGYTFAGWYTAASGGSKVTSATKVTKSMTLYARWEVTKPSTMTGFTYSERTSNSVTLKWTKNSSATGYIIQQYKNGGWTTLKRITKNSTVSYKVTGLSASKTYKFKVVPYKTLDGVTVNGGAATKSVKTLPSYTKGFTYSARTAASVTLKWTKNTSADGYVIEQYKSGGWKTIKTITKNSTVSYKVTGLKPSVNYKFRIKAYKMDGSAKLYAPSYSTKSVKTRPSTVKAFSYNARTKTTISLRWNKNTSADGYVIQQYKGGKWTTIKTVSKNSTVNHKVTGLKKGTTYKFRIRAYKYEGSTKLYSLSYTTKNIKTLSK